MSFADKISNAAEKAVGKAKEAIGDLTDNEQLEAEGKLQQGKADAKQGVEDVKDSAKQGVEDIKEGVAGAFNDAVDSDKKN